MIFVNHNYGIDHIAGCKLPYLSLSISSFIHGKVEEYTCKSLMDFAPKIIASPVSPPYNEGDKIKLRCGGDPK
jgi:hypothetical protein